MGGKCCGKCKRCKHIAHIERLFDLYWKAAVSTERRIPRTLSLKRKHESFLCLHKKYNSDSNMLALRTPNPNLSAVNLRAAELSLAWLQEADFRCSSFLQTKPPPFHFADETERKQQNAAGTNFLPCSGGPGTEGFSHQEPESRSTSSVKTLLTVLCKDCRS